MSVLVHSRLANQVLLAFEQQSKEPGLETNLACLKELLAVLVSGTPKASLTDVLACRELVGLTLCHNGKTVTISPETARSIVQLSCALKELSPITEKVAALAAAAHILLFDSSIEASRL